MPIATGSHPIPSRTRQLSPSTPMVAMHAHRKSRSVLGLCVQKSHLPPFRITMRFLACLRLLFLRSRPLEGRRWEMPTGTPLSADQLVVAVAAVIEKQYEPGLLRVLDIRKTIRFFVMRMIDHPLHSGSTIIQPVVNHTKAFLSSVITERNRSRERLDADDSHTDHVPLEYQPRRDKTGVSERRPGLEIPQRRNDQRSYMRAS